MHKSKMDERERESIKAGVFDILEGCKDGDIKEVIAELSVQFIELWGCVDGVVTRNDMFIKSVKDLVKTLSLSLYFYSISNIALTELLIDSGIVNRSDLREKISTSSEKERLAEYLGLNFLDCPGIENIKTDQLSKWMNPNPKDKIEKVH